MKKCLYVLLCLSIAGMLTAGCSKAAGTEGTANKESGKNAKSAAAVDVDLTALSSTMVYAEVFSMMSNPDEYFGKTIKMSGPYGVSFYDKTGLYYHYIIIEDAAACCQQGLEFMWNGNHDYPKDYPKELSEIEVTGVFESYEELGQTYYYLVVDDIIVK